MAVYISILDQSTYRHLLKAVDKGIVSHIARGPITSPITTVGSSDSTPSALMQS
jgi:hypothetical protein